MAKLSAKQIFKQLKYDLIGKDSYRGVTLTYSWLANQFGHFSLGFIPAFILFAILKHNTPIQHPAYWAAIIVAGAWLLFELYNFLGPLLFKKAHKAINKNSSGCYTFTPDWTNIAYDTATDVCFFWIGALTVGVILDHNYVLLYVLRGLLILVLYPSYNWYKTKMFQQAACYPFQFRLSQWSCIISEEKKKLITNFLQDNSSGKHLLLFGENGSGKTSLSVALANELSIRHQSCSYVTAMKLFSLFFEKNKDLSAKESLELWGWRQASLLIIDDINPSLPVESNLITCETFFKFLNNQLHSEANIKALKNNNIIWVLGNNEPNNLKQYNWATLLESIGIEKHKIISLKL